MARLDDALDHRSPRRTRHERSPSPGREIDWARVDDDAAHSAPRPRRRRQEIHRPASGGDAALGRPPPARASLSSPSMRVLRPATAMPLMVRSSTGGGHGKVTKVPFHDDRDDLSRSDSRKTGSRRDGSPRSHHYRSTPTPDSKPSSRTSVSESDSETDLSASTQEEKKVDLIPDKQRLKERMNTKRVEDRDRRREKVIYEEDMGEDRHRSRRHASPERRTARRRSPEEERSTPRRHSPEGERHRHRHRHSSQSAHRRHASPEDERPPRSSSKRSSKKYYESEAPASHHDRPSSLRRSNTVAGSHAASSHSAGSSRRSSRLGNFLSLPGQPRAPERPPRIVSCVVCMDELPSTKMAKLKCKHSMCNSCLKRSFKLSTTDPQHMPPKCCTDDHISLKHVEKLFDDHFKKRWNRKFREFSTRNRIYCPSRRCGEWIKPENMYYEDSRKGGRKAARCGRCKTKVCCACNGKWHTSRECPQDEETNNFLEQAKQEGWQRCHRCKSMVELKEGCNHMTCRCGAEFCMICGTKWKGCECPWFNFDAVEADRLEHMQIPFQPRPGPFDPGHPSPRDVGPRGAPMGPGMRPRTQTYQDDIISRRLQEQLDDDLARRLGGWSSFGEPREDYRGDIGNTIGLGNQGGHFMNEDFRRRPENFIVPPPPPPLAPSPRHVEAPPPPHGSPFDRRDQGTDYLSGVNRARGVRGSSPERRAPRGSSMDRRLADRFSTEHRTNPGNRPTAPPPPPGLGGSGPMPPLPPGMPRMPTMPMAPVPPPAVPGGATLSRRHTMEDSMYNNPRSTQSPDRIVVSGRRSRRSQEAETPPSDRRRRKDEPVRMSTLAGLGGPGRGMSRVYEWAAHVHPGEPEDEVQAAKAPPPVPTVADEED